MDNYLFNLYSLQDNGAKALGRVWDKMRSKGTAKALICDGDLHGQKYEVQIICTVREDDMIGGE